MITSNYMDTICYHWFSRVDKVGCSYCCKRSILGFFILCSNHWFSRIRYFDKPAWRRKVKCCAPFVNLPNDRVTAWNTDWNDVLTCVVCLPAPGWEDVKSPQLSVFPRTMVAPVLTVRGVTFWKDWIAYRSMTAGVFDDFWVESTIHL
jgi:hypothetical protein